MVIRNTQKAQCGVTYAGFHGDAEDFARNHQSVAKELANMMGYWFFVDSLSTELTTDARHKITLKLSNHGSAIAYNKYNVSLRLTDQSGKHTEYKLNNFDTTKIAVGQSYTYTYYIKRPDIPDGKYSLSIRMYDKNNRTVFFALTGVGKDGYYKLADITLPAKWS